MRVCIVCTCDESYLPLLRVFLASLRQNGGVEYNVCVRLINVSDPPDFLDECELIYDKVELSNTRDKLIKEGMLLHDVAAADIVRRNLNSIYRGARWLYSDKMAYCANIKFTTINELLPREDYIFYFDADTIIRSDISDLFSRLDKHDMLIKTTPSNPAKPFSEPYQHLYHTGMIGISSNIKTKAFFKLIESRCHKTDFYNWDTDQIEFAKMIEKDEIDINIGDIADTYKDELYNPSSHIWCGAGPGKASNKLYVDEMNKYAS